jgi:hypothetical protein
LLTVRYPIRCRRAYVALRVILRALKSR